MEAITHEVLMELIVDDSLDCWDLAMLIECIRKDEKLERADLTRNFSLANYTVQQCIDFFRLPARMTVHRTSASGLEVLCLVLKRLSYPCRYLDLELFFQRPRVECCMLFNLGVSHIDNMFSTRLTDFNQPWLTIPRLMEYSAVVHAKGAPLDLCWGFIDGTVRGMCKPGVHQREVYNGHKRKHGLKFQSVVTPNGLIAHLYGPMPGRRHDAALLLASGFLNFAETNLFAPDGRPLYVYGDPAYPLRPHLQRPFRGQLTAAQQQHNTDMSTVRQAVEWQFGRVLKLWAFLSFEDNLKLYLSPVGKLYRIGALLTNCHGCIHGNQTSQYFGLNPPTLEEYLY